MLFLAAIALAMLPTPLPPPSYTYHFRWLGWSQETLDQPPTARGPSSPCYLKNKTLGSTNNTGDSSRSPTDHRRRHDALDVTLITLTRAKQITIVDPEFESFPEEQMQKGISGIEQHKLDRKAMPILETQESLCDAIHNLIWVLTSCCNEWYLQCKYAVEAPFENTHLGNAIINSDVMVNYSPRKGILFLYTYITSRKCLITEIIIQGDMRQAERDKIQQPFLEFWFPKNVCS